MSPLARTFVAAGLVSGWLVMLLVGWSLGGAIHLALVAAVALFPWRELRD